VKSYGKILNLGHRLNKGILGAGTLYITEKIDGTNFRFRRKRNEKLNMDEIVYGTHHTELGSLALISQRCKHCREHKVDECFHTFYFIARWIDEHVDVEDLEPGLVYFGEGALKHTLTYENLPTFVGIDIWVEAEKLPFERRGQDPPEGRYMSWDVAARIFEKIGIPAIALVWKGQAQEWVGKQPNLMALIGTSYYGGPQLAEGIVLKNYDAVDSYGHQLFAKLKREEFAERAKATFGVKPKGSPLEYDVVATFCNAVRINKGIDRLLEAGLELEMKLTKTLFILVAEDILQEEILEIQKMSKGRSLDFKAFYGGVAKRCAAQIAERKLTRA
jgi:hypothetical protein